MLKLRKGKLPIILPSIIINGFIDILLVYYFYTYILNSLQNWSYMVNTTLYSKSPTYKPSSVKRGKCVFYQCQAWVKLQLALHLLLLMIFQLYHLPPPASPVSNSFTLLAWSLDSSPCMPAVVLCLYFSRYCTVRLKMFSFCVYLFFMYYLCEK